jgi:hypothetical protein
MRVRAIRPIRAGEQLTVSYTSLTEPRRLRAQDLLDSKHFLCACERCCEPIQTSIDRYLEARMPSAHIQGLGFPSLIPLMLSSCLDVGSTPAYMEGRKDPDVFADGRFQGKL